MPKEFLYRGFNTHQVQQMSMDDFSKLLPAKYRRKLVRGLPAEHRKLLESVRAAKKNPGTSKAPIKTHARDMLILPEMIGSIIAVHNGKEFTNVEINETMVGHLLGEFAITGKKVIHGNPGIGASRSSMYVPLK